MYFVTKVSVEKTYITQCTVMYSLCKLVSVHYKYLSMITSKNWLKYVVSIKLFPFLHCRFLFGACVYLCPDFPITNLSF